MTSTIKTNRTERVFLFELIIVSSSNTEHFLLQAENQEKFFQWTTVITNAIMANLSTVETVDKKGSQKVLPKKDVERLQKINPKCVDCQAGGPEWTSINLGIFFCIECAGVHRSLGVHISKSRSLIIDNLDELTLTTIGMIGNDFVNGILEAGMEAKKIKPILPSTSRKEREEFIRAKYVEKSFLIKDESINWTKYLTPVEDDAQGVLRAILNGAQINQLNSKKFSPLYRALRKKHYHVANILLLNGADVNQKIGIQQNTALHMAAINNDRCAVALLIINGADKTIKDSEGKSSVDVSTENLEEAFHGIFPPSVVTEDKDNPSISLVEPL